MARSVYRSEYSLEHIKNALETLADKLRAARDEQEASEDGQKTSEGGQKSEDGPDTAQETRSGLQFSLSFQDNDVTALRSNITVLISWSANVTQGR